MTDKLVSRLDSLQRALGDISTFLKAKSGLSDDEHFEAERCLDQISRSIRALKSISKSSEHESASPEKPVDPKEVALQARETFLFSVWLPCSNQSGKIPFVAIVGSNTSRLQGVQRPTVSFFFEFVLLFSTFHQKSHFSKIVVSRS